MDVGKVNGVISIPTSLEGSFFRYWLQFLSPIHNLSEKEIIVVTAFLKERHKLSKAITDEKVLDDVLMSKETKRKIREECGLAQAYFQIIIGKLRKAKVIVDNKINPKFIPKNIKEGDKQFQLLLHFNLDE